MITVGFTGHRPKDLVGVTYQKFSQALEVTLASYDVHDLVFVTGGALGIDTWAAEWAIARNIPVHLVLPFQPDVMSKFWRQWDVDRFHEHIKAAYMVTIMTDGESYNVENYQRRNEAMVDLSDLMIAVWSGKPMGGTANCVRYILDQRVPWKNIYPLVADA